MTTSHTTRFHVHQLASLCNRGTCEYPFRAKSFVFVLYPIVLLSFIWRQQARVLMFLSLVAGNDNDSMYDESIRYLLGRLFLHA